MLQLIAKASSRPSATSTVKKRTYKVQVSNNLCCRYSEYNTTYSYLPYAYTNGEWFLRARRGSGSTNYNSFVKTKDFITFTYGSIGPNTQGDNSPGFSLVQWSNGSAFAAHTNQGAGMKSTDGLTWTSQATSAGSWMTIVAWSQDGKAVFSSPFDNATNYLFISNYGSTVQTLGVPGGYSALHLIGTKGSKTLEFWSFAPGNSTYYFSNTGTTWTTATSSTVMAATATYFQSMDRWDDPYGILPTKYIASTYVSGTNQYSISNDGGVTWSASVVPSILSSQQGIFFDKTSSFTNPSYFALVSPGIYSTPGFTASSPYTPICYRPYDTTYSNVFSSNSYQQLNENLLMVFASGQVAINEPNVFTVFDTTTGKVVLPSKTAEAYIES